MKESSGFESDLPLLTQILQFSCCQIGQEIQLALARVLSVASQGPRNYELSSVMSAELSSAMSAELDSVMTEH